MSETQIEMTMTWPNTVIVRDRATDTVVLRMTPKELVSMKTTFDQAREALQHCQKVFQSMADRGAYPAELLPFSTNPLTPHADNPYFLGKQGFRFILDALAAMEEA